MNRGDIILQTEPLEKEFTDPDARNFKKFYHSAIGTLSTQFGHL
jgi:hypothetical protein